jgi:hypothetical protein
MDDIVLFGHVVDYHRKLKLLLNSEIEKHLTSAAEANENLLYSDYQ